MLDVSNPLDFSQGFPPTLFVKDTDSLAEQIQRAFPAARVVRSLNTMTAAVMVEPGRVGGGDRSVFVSGDDQAAKQIVVDLLESMGHTDVIDLGDPRRAGPRCTSRCGCASWEPPAPLLRRHGGALSDQGGSGWRS